MVGDGVAGDGMAGDGAVGDGMAGVTQRHVVGGGMATRWDGGIAGR